MSYWLVVIFIFFILVYFVFGILAFITDFFPWRKLFAKRSKCCRCLKVEENEYLKEFEGYKYCSWCLSKIEFERKYAEKCILKSNDDKDSFDGICEDCKQYCYYLHKYEGKTYCTWCLTSKKLDKRKNI